VHCRASATCARDDAELTTDEGKSLIDQIADMGTPLLVFTGGDPAKRSDVGELIAHAKKRNLTPAVTPSGTPLMTRELLGQWRDAGLARIAVSVDGADDMTHDRFRGVDGSFAHSLRILQDARDLGIERQVNTTLGPHNRHSLREMAALVPLLMSGKVPLDLGLLRSPFAAIKTLAGAVTGRGELPRDPRYVNHPAQKLRIETGEAIFTLDGEVLPTDGQLEVTLGPTLSLALHP